MSGVIEVISPGLLTTIQDHGRWGWQDCGVPVSGPMDPWAFRAALALVGNREDEAAIEFTLSGPTLSFSHETRVALSGGVWDVVLESSSGAVQWIATGTVCTCPAGSLLRVGRCNEGARGYVACSGGIDVPPVLGSRSTHLGCKLGGLEGRALRAGDRIPLADRVGPPRLFRAESWERPAGTPKVRVLPGPHLSAFTADAAEAFVSGAYVVTSDSNRMGYRLEGPALSLVGDADIISEAVTFGTIQVPREGQPIVLMADHPTTGGYSKIGTVIAADLGLLGQLSPGATLSFAWCSRQEATTALLARERAFL